MMVELAWCRLRYQPQSELARWYRRRFSEKVGRSRKVGVVALARKLAIALWRFLEQGLVPDGAKLKTT
jgi:transposase